MGFSWFNQHELNLVSEDLSRIRQYSQRRDTTYQC